MSKESGDIVETTPTKSQPELFDMTDEVDKANRPQKVSSDKVIHDHEKQHKETTKPVDVISSHNATAKGTSRFRSFQFQMTDYISGSSANSSSNLSSRSKNKEKASKRKGADNWANKRFRGLQDSPTSEPQDDNKDPCDASFSTAKDKLMRVKGDKECLTEQQVEERNNKVEGILQSFKTEKQQEKLNVEDTKKASKPRHPAYCKPFEYVGPMQYGVAHKSLGTKVSVCRPFKPPVPGDEAQNETVDKSIPEGTDPKLVQLIESQIMTTVADISWDQIAGLIPAKKVLKEIVVLPFLRPEIFTGIRAPPKGVLLFGPPGTGKTMIGKCVASQAKATFFNITASSLTSKWVGEGEKLVKALFAVARINLPAIIFIDEVDSLLSSRSDSEHESSRRIKTEFLVQLDGLCTSKDERLLVLGATNRPQEIDEAARRRFSKRLYIPLPDLQARMDILNILLKEIKHEMTAECLARVAQLTEGFSGADVHVLCKEASMGPIRALQDIATAQIDQIGAVNVQDFVVALENVRPSVDLHMLDQYKQWNNTFGSTCK